MKQEPILPRPADNPENLRRLREEAARRLDREDRPRPPAPVYGGPPLPPPRSFWRRWMVWAIGILVVVVVWLLIKHGIRPPNPLPVYGGPPIPPPHPPAILLALRDLANRLS